MPETAASPTLTVRALLLDMDGTLVDSDAVVERVWRDWALKHGFEPGEVVAVAHGQQAHVTMGTLLPDRPAEVNRAEGRTLLARETSDMAGVVPVPGAAAFLAVLAGLPVPHALVTSADEALSTARMAAAGLPMPPVRISAESVSASKPDPEGFLKAAAELGQRPDDCVDFEDSAAGVAAAQAAGMRVVGVGVRARDHAPDVCVPDLERVRVEAGAVGVVRVHIAA